MLSLLLFSPSKNTQTKVLTRREMKMSFLPGQQLLRQDILKQQELLQSIAFVHLALRLFKRPRIRSLLVA
jgi:hypothetical protein